MAERTASSLIVAAARIGCRRRHTEPAGACGVDIIAGVARTADAPVGSAGLAHAGTNVALGTRALARFEEAYWEGRDAAILPSRATRCRCNVRDSESGGLYCKVPAPPTPTPGPIRVTPRVNGAVDTHFAPNSCVVRLLSGSFLMRCWGILSPRAAAEYD